jgi:hypothetical protein
MLLPDKLINPTRFALENPTSYEPEKLASYLQSAAHAGSRDLQKFKKEWHSETVRELWQSVNNAEVPQGEDAWSVDYAALLRNKQTSITEPTLSYGVGQQQESPNEDPPNKIIEDFKFRHQDLKITIVDDTKGFPLDLIVAQLEFRIEHDKKYKVIGKPDTADTALRTNILGHIDEKDKLVDVLVRNQKDV